jgi:hypothetical protein
LEPEIDPSSPNAKSIDNTYLAKKLARNAKRARMTEYQRYINSSPIDYCENSLQYWCEPLVRKAWPALSQWARDVLSAPASTADIERLFSHCGQTHTDRRNRMNVETLEALELTRAWMKLENKPMEVMEMGN